MCVIFRFLVHQFILIYCIVVQCQSSFVAEECGTTDNSSFGDVRTEVPWMASIFRKSKTNCTKWVLWKSGYIIGPSTVVMSGRHFWNYTTNVKKDSTNSKVLPIRPSEFLVGVGVSSDDLREADYYTHYYHVKSIIPHYKSYRKYSAFDIAVIHLTRPLLFNAYVRPICLSKGWNMAPTENFTSTISAPALKAGFGGSGGFQHIYRNPVVLYNYPLDKDCSTDLKQITPLTAVSHEELPIKRCVDLDSGLSFKQNDRWYLASLMTGGLLSDPEAEAWTFFSSVEKTYFWIRQNLMCGPEMFTCYEGKCVQIPSNLTTSSDLLSSCGETENTYASIIEAQEQCMNTEQDPILQRWCIDCPDVESDMLDKGEINSATTTTPQPPTTFHPGTNNTNVHNGGTKISISPSSIFVSLPKHFDGDDLKPDATTIELPSSKTPVSANDSDKSNSTAKKFCSLMNMDSNLCKIMEAVNIFE